jgi:mRNA interferase MazF
VKRGDIVIVSIQGDYGKPRPAVIVQSDLFNDSHGSIILCPLTSDIQEAPLFRLTIEPNKDNGLTKQSQIMIDKVTALKRERIVQNIGHIDDDSMIKLNRSLALFLGIAQ